jgi:hypothetical protein
MTPQQRIEFMDRVDFYKKVYGMSPMKAIEATEAVMRGK